MARSTFKTMYLVSKSDLENRNDNNVKKNFKLSLQNRDICDGGMSVSVKPIKTRVINKQNAAKQTNMQLDASDNEDATENSFALPQKKMQQYSNAIFKPQSENPFYYPKNDDDSNDDEDKRHDIDLEKSSHLNIIKSSDFRNNKDDSFSSNLRKYNNNGHKVNDINSTPNYEYGTIPSNEEKHNDNDKREQIGQRLKRKKHDEKMKSYKIKRLQKSYSKNSKRKFLGKRNLNNISHLEEPPINRNENNLMLQYQKSNASKDEDSHLEQLPLNKNKNNLMLQYDTSKDEDSQNENNLMLQYEKNDTSKDEDSQNRYEIEEVDDNQINKSAPNLKKRKILDDVQLMEDNQWLGRIKSRLNDKRVQFKRKRDNIGYRINPDDISKSLIKPSDFTYLNKTDSSDYLDKWKSLKELRKKPFRNKRFKLYH